MTALHRVCASVFEEPDDEARGEPEWAVRVAMLAGVRTGAKETRLSTAQAELKVFRRFAFFVGGSSFGV